MNSCSIAGKKETTKKALNLLNLLTSVSVAILFALPVQAEQLVTLKQLVEKTISSNPEVQSRYHAYLGAGYEQDAVKGGFFT